MCRTLAAITGLAFALAPAAAADELPCLGDGCDAYVAGPLNEWAKDARKERLREKVLGGTLGGLAGGLIGNEAADTEGALIGGALGVVLGMQKPDKKRMERNARYYRDQYLAGTDMSYDPSRPLPVVAHWAANPRRTPTVDVLPLPLGPDD